MITTVKIGEKDMYADYGCILKNKQINFPVLQEKKVVVPSYDGAIDLADAVTDEPMFENREIVMQFLCLQNNAKALKNIIGSYMHGKKMQVVFSDDAAFFYYGRISVEEIEEVTHGIQFTVRVDADPYKYDIESSMVDWEWDTLDFEEGYINETGQLVVNGEIEVPLICRRKRAFPDFIVSAPMQVEYDSVTYNLHTGTQKLYKLFLKEGLNVMKFKGNGTVSIDYRGGEL